MVERWSQLGDPTPMARLAQIRALLDLCMMDRAWTRLQSLSGDRNARERFELNARMFVERGWPKRAGKVLDEAEQRFAGEEVWGRLRAEAAVPPRRPPANAPGPEVDFNERLEVAETYLATGAYLKARRLLEQLERDRPDLSRVGDLLWALRGDYDLTGTTLNELVERYAPAAGAFAELPDLDDDPDNTDSITVADVPVMSTWDGGSGSFPTLFREGDEGPETTGGTAADVEITQATSVAEIEQAVAEQEDFGTDDDTQVLRIVKIELERHEAQRSAPEDPFSPPTSPGIVDELEGEDDAVVVLTRAQERQPPHRNRDLLPLEEPPARAELPMVDEPLGPEVEPEAMERGAAPPTSTWWLVLAMVLLLGSAMMLVLLAWWTSLAA